MKLVKLIMNDDSVIYVNSFQIIGMNENFREGNFWTTTVRLDRLDSFYNCKNRAEDIIAQCSEKNFIKLTHWDNNVITVNVKHIVRYEKHIKEDSNTYIVVDNISLTVKETTEEIDKLIGVI